VHTPNYSEELKKKIDQDANRIASLHFGPQGIKIYGIQSAVSFYSYLVDSNELIIQNQEDLNRLGVIVNPSLNQTVWGIYTRTYQDSLLIKVQDENFNSKLNFKVKRDGNFNVLSGINYLQLTDSTLLFSYQNSVFLIQNAKIIDSQTLNHPILDGSMEKLSSNNIVVGIQGLPQVLFTIKDDKIKLIKTEQKIISMSGLTQDREGGIWRSSLSNGVYYQSALGSKKISSFGSNSIEAIYHFEDSIFISTFDSTWIYRNSNQTKIMSVVNEKGGGKEYFEHKPNKPIAWLPDNWSKRHLSYSDTNISISQNGFLLFYGDSIVKISHDLGISLKSYCIRKHKGYVYMGTVQGLKKYDAKTLKEIPFETQTKVLNLRITDIQIINKENLLLSTLGGGLALIDPNGKVVQSFPEFKQVNISNINEISKKDEHHYWIATNKGIARLHFTKLENGQYKLRFYNKTHGLNTNEIDKICVAKSNLYYSSKSETFVIKIEDLIVNETKPKLQVKYQLIQDDAIFLKLTSTTYKSPYESTFQYSLTKNGDKSSFKTTKQNTLRFEQLSPGEYSLKVIALNNDGVSSKPQTVSFAIPFPFYQTWWFYVLVLASIVALVAFIFRMRNRRIRKNLALQEELITQKQRAMAAQMNPHFIFNAMSSIQSLVLENKTEEADQYLSKFARLTRKVLDDSSKLLIPVSEELERLKEYIEIENLRFGNSIIFKTQIDANLKEHNILTPTMLLQTLIENSIIHGILPMKNPGKITVSFHKKGELVFIEIIDNGIGLNESKRRKAFYKGDKTSKGLALINERIDSLNIMYQSVDFKIEMKDRFESENEHGTRVCVTIPFLINVEV
jgi:anti-sigma regulatory factor (Ser/Thr protein kinase)